ncbi:hypothetical protein AKJ16_DCAP26181 [Drosera capensis]
MCCLMSFVGCRLWIMEFISSGRLTMLGNDTKTSLCWDKGSLKNRHFHYSNDLYHFLLSGLFRTQRNVQGGYNFAL